MSHTTRLEVRWFPPSWLLLRNEAGTVVYVDPAWIQANFRRHPGAVRFTHWPEPMDGLPEPDMPTADVVLVTHHHQDHVKTATLRRLCREDTVVLAPARCADLIGRPFRPVCTGDQVDIGGFQIRGVPAHNLPEGHSTRKQHREGERVPDGRPEAGYVRHIGLSEVGGISSGPQLGPVRSGSSPRIRRLGV